MIKLWYWRFRFWLGSKLERLGHRLKWGPTLPLDFTELRIKRKGIITRDVQ